MKRFLKVLKWFSICLIFILFGVAILVATRQNRTFDEPYPQLSASKDSAVIAQGKYLFYGPAHCMDCHASQEDLEKVEQGIPVPPKGGRVWNLPIGTLTSANITSDPETGIGKMTDPEFARALRYGVDRTGRALFDFMPFHNLSDKDMVALMSFVRTFPAEKHATTAFEPNMLGKILNAFVFKPVGPTGEVPKSVSPEAGLEYGKYLAASVANCRGCHTNRDLKTGEFVGPEYAGGFHMPINDKPGSFVVTPNLTPDPETGRMSGWTEERFIQRFRQGKLIKESHMPWGPFKQFSDGDLKAIFNFLQSLDPIKNDPGATLVTES